MPRWADQNKNLKETEDMIRRAIDFDRRGARKNSVNLTQEEDQDNAAYVDSLGWVLFRRGQIEEARKQLERAAALPDGDDPVIWDHLGDTYQKMAHVPRSPQRLAEIPPSLRARPAPPSGRPLPGSSAQGENGVGASGSLRAVDFPLA